MYFVRCQAYGCKRFGVTGKLVRQMNGVSLHSESCNFVRLQEELDLHRSPGARASTFAMQLVLAFGNLPKTASNRLGIDQQQKRKSGGYIEAYPWRSQVR